MSLISLQLIGVVLSVSLSVGTYRSCHRAAACQKGVMTTTGDDDDACRMMGMPTRALSFGLRFGAVLYRVLCESIRFLTVKIIKSVCNLGKLGICCDFTV